MLRAFSASSRRPSERRAAREAGVHAPQPGAGAETFGSGDRRAQHLNGLIAATERRQDFAARVPDTRRNAGPAVGDEPIDDREGSRQVTPSMSRSARLAHDQRSPGACMCGRHPQGIEQRGSVVESALRNTRPRERTAGDRGEVLAADCSRTAQRVRQRSAAAPAPACPGKSRQRWSCRRRSTGGDRSASRCRGRHWACRSARPTRPGVRATAPSPIDK